MYDIIIIQKYYFSLFTHKIRNKILASSSFFNIQRNVVKKLILVLNDMDYIMKYNIIYGDILSKMITIIFDMKVFEYTL